MYLKQNKKSVNLFIAVILEGFSESANEEQAFVTHLNEWRDAWNTLDPQGTGVLPAQDVLKLVKLVSKPIGLDIDWKDTSAVYAIHMMQHLRTTLPIKIYKVRAKMNVAHGENELISPITIVTSNQPKKTISCLDVFTQQSQVVHPKDSSGLSELKDDEAMVWVCHYQSTLRTIAKAMFDDFSEEDAKFLQEKHGLADQKLKMEDYQEDELRAWFATNLIVTAWRTHKPRVQVNVRKRRFSKKLDAKSRDAKAMLGHQVEGKDAKTPSKSKNSLRSESKSPKPNLSRANTHPHSLTTPASDKTQPSISGGSLGHDEKSLLNPRGLEPQVLSDATVGSDGKSPLSPGRPLTDDLPSEQKDQNAASAHGFFGAHNRSVSSPRNNLDTKVQQQQQQRQEGPDANPTEDQPKSESMSYPSLPRKKLPPLSISKNAEGEGKGEGESNSAKKQAGGAGKNAQKIPGKNPSPPPID
uniref:EF-hand domain-containing protein n=1 Tax=Lotharella globosa TaxID=91324 RepID=A0A7S4DPT4_9EUKA